MTITTPRMRAAALILPLLLLATAGCDIAMADHKQKETAEWRKTYELQPGGRVEIGNINGRIDVQAVGGQDVEIVAQKIASGASSRPQRQRWRASKSEESSPSTVKIETKVQRSSGGLFGGGNLQVEYSVRVPATAELRVSTVNGGVEIEGRRRQDQRRDDQRRHQGARRRRADRSQHHQRRRRRGPCPGARSGREAGMHERRHPSPAAVQREGVDLGAHHQRRHRHERADPRLER